MMLTTTRWHAAERYDIFIPGYGRAYWRPDPRAYAIQVEKNSNNKNNILIKIKYTNLFPDDPNPLDDTKSTTNNKSDIINYFLHIYDYGGSNGLFEYVYLNLAFLPSLVYKE